MHKVDAYELNRGSHSQTLLIATQGSTYKDAIVKGIVDAYKAKPVYIKVIDVTDLPGVKVEDWDAFVILLTWQKGKPQKEAATFLKKYYQKDKMFVMTTSAGGRGKVEGVDGLTGPSIMENVPERITIFTSKLSDVLGTP